MLAAIEERHLVPAGERSFDDVSAEKDGSPKYEELHNVFMILYRRRLCTRPYAFQTVVEKLLASKTVMSDSTRSVGF